MVHILPRSSLDHRLISKYLTVMLTLRKEEEEFSSLSGLASANSWAKMQETGQATTSSIAASSLPSSSEKSSSSALQIEVKEGPESDEEIRRVPEMGGESAGTSASRPDAGREGVQATGSGQRKRGRTPADKESKRLKRLLRNRVSAQQARERKKAYMTDLETRAKDWEKKNSELEERLSTLQNENQMLRHILKNTTASRRGSTGSVNEGTL